MNCPECGNRHFTSCGSPSCGANGSLSKQCFHIGRAVSRDYLSFSYYPVWNGLLDLFADNDVYMHSLTRLQWVNNIVYDIENNLISSDVSVNTYSALVSLGETQLASLILDALKGCISPASCRAFLSPDPSSSFNKVLKRQSTG